LPLIGQPRDAACAGALLTHKRASEPGAPGPAFGDADVQPAVIAGAVRTALILRADLA